MRQSILIYVLAALAASWGGARGATASQERTPVPSSSGAAAVAAQDPSTPARASTPQARPVSLFHGLEHGARPYRLDEQLDALDLALEDQSGGAATRSAGLINPALRPQSPERYRVNLATGTGTLERVWVQEAAANHSRPLLVVFHRFGVSELDAMVTTRYFEEARRRQWYVIAPRSLGQFHFSSLTSQIHTKRAIDWALQNFDIDATRIYAVGFSMGGGAALNYAARNLDATQARFAAVASLSGLLDHEHAYANEIVETRDLYDDVFGNGAPGSANPWLMLRAGLFRLDNSLQITPGTDLARNLAHTNVHLFRSNGDIPYITVQHDVLAAHLAALPLSSGQKSAAVSSYVGHSWDSVDERLVCDWLRQFQLATPSTARTLADQDGAYYHFELEQDAPGTFSPFTWALDLPNNAVALTDTENVERITVRTTSAGLSATSTLQVTLAAADGLADEVVLQNWPLPPLAVSRDGSPSAAWTHDALGQRLTLHEFDPAAHVWQIQP